MRMGTPCSIMVDALLTFETETLWHEKKMERNGTDCSRKQKNFCRCSHENDKNYFFLFRKVGL